MVELEAWCYSESSSSSKDACGIATVRDSRGGEKQSRGSCRLCSLGTGTSTASITSRCIRAAATSIVAAWCTLRSAAAAPSLELASRDVWSRSWTDATLLYVEALTANRVWVGVDRGAVAFGSLEVYKGAVLQNEMSASKSLYPDEFTTYLLARNIKVNQLAILL